MVITSDTYACSSGTPGNRSNRFWAIESSPVLPSPVLRTDFRPDSTSEQGSCSGEEREMAIQGNLLARQADTSLRPCDVGETQVETTSAVCMDAKFIWGFKRTSETLKSNQDLDSGGVESKDIIKEDVPVALRRSITTSN